MRAIVSSGCSDDPVMSKHAACGFGGVIPKPYHPRQLGEVVREVLSGPAAGGGPSGG